MRLRALGYPMSWRRPFERSVDPERLRRRVLAFTGLWFLLAGLLAALGFGAVLLLTLTIVLIGAGTAGAVWLLHRYGVREQLGVVLRSIRSLARQLKARLDHLGLQRRLQRFAARVSKLAALASDRARAVLARVMSRSRAWASDVLQTGVVLPSAPVMREPVAVDPQQQALRLNELGAQLRREGNHELAAEQHRAALAIVRDLGDRRAEALTLNNLALALSHTGVPTALQHFEQSLVVLRELGDEEHEGQVIANLGFVHRRQGRSEEAETLLHEALDKLPPGSSAYRHVEEQLRRAS